MANNKKESMGMAKYAARMLQFREQIQKAVIDGDIPRAEELKRKKKEFMKKWKK